MKGNFLTHRKNKNGREGGIPQIDTDLTDFKSELHGFLSNCYCWNLIKSIKLDS